MSRGSTGTGSKNSVTSVLFVSPCSLLPVLHLPWRPAGEPAGAVCVCGQHAAGGAPLGGHLCRAELKRPTGTGGRKRRLSLIGRDGFIQSQILKQNIFVRKSQKTKTIPKT